MRRLITIALLLIIMAAIGGGVYVYQQSTGDSEQDDRETIEDTTPSKDSVSEGSTTTEQEQTKEEEKKDISEYPKQPELSLTETYTYDYENYTDIVKVRYPAGYAMKDESSQSGSWDVTLTKGDSIIRFDITAGKGDIYNHIEQSITFGSYDQLKYNAFIIGKGLLGESVIPYGLFDVYNEELQERTFVAVMEPSRRDNFSNSVRLMFWVTEDVGVNNLMNMVEAVEVIPR